MSLEIPKKCQQVTLKFAPLMPYLSVFYVLSLHYS
jgi:hypothetical protein